MPTITLNCLVVGENPYENAFNIKTNLTKAICELKEAIKVKKAPEFDNFAADKLILWKVDISLEENGELIAVNTKINTNIKDELGGVELTSLSKISKHFPSQPAIEHLHIVLQRPVEAKDIHCTGGNATTTTTITTLNKAKRLLSETQYVRKHLANNDLKAKNFYVYFNHSTLKEGVEVLHKTLEALRDDSELGNLVRRILGRDVFFKSDKAKIYFQRKKRKDDVLLGTETTL
ncbi:10205_t:CDS:2, partial [Funneliformis geosporum]